MAWETRKGRRYYYEKVREGERVVSRFVGSGFLGECAATHAQYQRQERMQQRIAIRAEREEIDALDGDVAAVYSGIETLTRAVLTLAGYHQHDRGHWRKRRKMVTNDDKQ